jgi:NAD(P)-dependent dehydrogenase (short-subunit alcohol dehydrogenase family)
MKISAGTKAGLTGSASGIGRALAIAFATKGAKVLIADINQQGSEETLEMVKKAGGSGETYFCDVTKPEDVQKMADYGFEKWGGIDLLINNAGVAAAGLVGDIPIKDWEWIFAVNFWGMVYGCHFFIPKMKAQGDGYIVNVASAAGILSLPEMASYNTTKAAVIALSETLKGELAPHRIGVTALCPTFFKTNLLQTMRYTDEWQKEFSNAAFAYARITTEKIANITVKAIEREKLYVVPQLSGKIMWAVKRLSPGMFYWNFAFLNRIGKMRSLFLGMARRGMV